MKLAAIFFLLLAGAVSTRAEPEYPQMGPDIYDRQAEGTGQIAAAVARAKAEHKRVLADLGTNWCIWCRRLKQTLENQAEVSAVMKAGYVLVLVDVNHRDGRRRNEAVNAGLGNPMALGFPVLVVLDSDGQQLTTQETGALENGKDGHDPAKIIAFLRRWAPAK